ncbi:growth hormone secretagogue receptor type 1-like [Littorina saxatilis]|uniref:G-protein coupled receptors family 1 profile domain-containing protein n=1 Tax=Littorina saxatilis TaxID=31220 RepID=A0AAN9B6C0_9CAEN
MAHHADNTDDIITVTCGAVTSPSDVNNTSVPDLFLLLESEPMFIAASLLYKVGLVVVFVAGIVGNVMTLVIQHHIAGDSDTGLSVFISSLAVADSAMLAYSCASWYLLALNLLDPHDQRDSVCKIAYFLVYSLGLMPTWILVAMTLQRAASILFPHRVKAAWTARKAKVTVCVIVLASLALNSHMLYGRKLQTLPGGEQQCGYVSEEYRHVFEDVWPSVDSVLGIFLPFALLIGANVVLVNRVRRSVEEAKQSLATGSSRQQLQTREQKASNMTVTLICVSLAFLLLTLPLALYYVAKRKAGISIQPGATEYVREMADNAFAEAVCNILYLSNNAINFYIYILTGSRYREALKGMLGCRAAQCE